MPWMVWTIAALVLLALDTLIRYVRLRDEPKAWTPGAAITGALLWGAAWFVIASSLRSSMGLAAVQIALFGGLYIAIVLWLGTRIFARR